MVFQSYALYPHMSVFENIGFALENQGLPRAEIKARVEKVADLLQLTPYLARLPKALSGGQRQRVAIGRAIVRGAKVFLFDEPLSNLDAALRVQMRMEIARLNRSMPTTTMIYVTHDQVEAMTLADRIVVLQAGRVEQVGTPMELYERPANTFVAGFIGSPKMNLFGGDLAEKLAAKTIGVRPEHFTVSASGGRHQRHRRLLGNPRQRQFSLCRDAARHANGARTRHHQVRQRRDHPPDAARRTHPPLRRCRKENCLATGLSRACFSPTFSSSRRRPGSVGASGGAHPRRNRTRIPAFAGMTEWGDCLRTNFRPSMRPAMPIRVTIWNENEHEKTNKLVQQLYPDGIHNAVARAFDGDAAFRRRPRPSTSPSTA